MEEKKRNVGRPPKKGKGRPIGINLGYRTAVRLPESLKKYLMKEVEDTGSSSVSNVIRNILTTYFRVVRRYGTKKK